MFLVVVAMACCAAAAGSALGNAPCDALEGADAQRYEALGQAAIAQYGADNPAGAIQALLELRDICDEDPVLLYNLARAYHKAGNCQMALFWYERVVGNTGEFAHLVERQRTKAGEYLTALQLECTTSARVLVECSQPGLALTVGEQKGLTCPFEAWLPAGKTTLRATKSGLLPYEVEVNLVAGEKNRLMVPPLQGEGAAVSTVATLQITCPAGIETFVLVGAQAQTPLACGTPHELEPGQYQVVLADLGETRTVSLDAGQSVAMEIAGGQPERIGLVLGVRVAPGSGFGTGVLYDGNDVPLVPARELDGFEPTVFTFALEVELGWSFSDAWAVIVQPRVELANFSVLVSAMARWSVWMTDSLALRLAVGGGGGRLLLPIELRGQTETSIAHAGPVFAMTSVGLGWNIAGPLTVVGAVEARVGFPDTGVLVDWASVGLEVNL